MTTWKHLVNLIKTLKLHWVILLCFLSTGPLGLFLDGCVFQLTVKHFWCTKGESQSVIHDSLLQLLKPAIHCKNITLQLLIGTVFTTKRWAVSSQKCSQLDTTTWYVFSCPDYRKHMPQTGGYFDRSRSEWVPEAREDEL